MNGILVLDEIPKQETPTEQQVMIVLSGDDANESLGNGLEKKLVLEEPVQQNHSLVSVLRLQRLQIEKRTVTQCYETRSEFEISK